MAAASFLWQRDVVRQFVDYGGRCGELFGSRRRVTPTAERWSHSSGALESVSTCTDRSRCSDRRPRGSPTLTPVVTSGTDGGNDAGVLMTEDRRHRRRLNRGGWRTGRDRCHTPA